MNFTIEEVCSFTANMKEGDRVWFMPGDGRYQPKELKSILGYDQWAVWLAIVEMFWMLAQKNLGKMNAEEAELLSKALVFGVIDKITTTEQDKVEKGKAEGHDIIALRLMMSEMIPKKLVRRLHLGATSYDIISTAYALQAKVAFRARFWPKLIQVDQLFRDRISDNIGILQVARTHLQDAMPIDVGLWLAQLHSRFVDCSRNLFAKGEELVGKFSGAAGTYAAQNLILGTVRDQAEQLIMDLLGLKKAPISTQIAPPESMARFYGEMVYLSGVLANLGEDVRILQSSPFGEVTSVSSTSSAMPHKRSNPIAAENAAGMHVNVIAEYQKALGVLVSDLQRDLRNSCVMRSQSAVMVYAYQQLLAVERILKSLKVDVESCRRNFDVSGRLLVAEPLHLALQLEGVEDSHYLVNKVIVPHAVKHGVNLYKATDCCLMQPERREAWDRIPQRVKEVLVEPEKYIGSAREMAEMELDNRLS